MCVLSPFLSLPPFLSPSFPLSSFPLSSFPLSSFPPPSSFSLSPLSPTFQGLCIQGKQSTTMLPRPSKVSCVYNSLATTEHLAWETEAHPYNCKQFVCGQNSQDTHTENYLAVFISKAWVFNILSIFVICQETLWSAC